MIRELVVISGKGGTGKTSIAAALAALARPVVLADCDVDAPDLHLLTQPRIRERHDFSGGKKAHIEPAFCLGCGQCAQACRFDAIHPSDDNLTYTVDPVACEGCGACVPACTSDAIRFEQVTNGEWMVSETRFGPMVHARLHPGEENSGKLVTIVRREAQQEAADADIPLILIDSSPGIGCPVIASLAGADLALVIAEPTPSGLHDARRVLEVARQLHVPAALCVNRWDLHPLMAACMRAEAAATDLPFVEPVYEDPAFVEAQLRGLAVNEHEHSSAAENIRRLWDNVSAMIHQSQGRGHVCHS